MNSHILEQPDSDDRFVETGISKLWDRKRHKQVGDWLKVGLYSSTPGTLLSIAPQRSYPTSSRVLSRSSSALERTPTVWNFLISGVASMTSFIPRY